MKNVERQKVFWDDKGETIKRFHEVDCVLALEYDKLLAQNAMLEGCLAKISHTYETEAERLKADKRQHLKLALAAELENIEQIKSLQEQVSLMREALELIESRFGPCQDELIFSKRLAITKVRATLQALKQKEGETK